MGGGTQGKAQTGNAAADNKEIVGFHQMGNRRDTRRTADWKEGLRTAGF